MSYLDWAVLISTLLAIVVYGSWKTRKNKNLESYLKGNNTEKWMTIGLSIMATQASAITFLSTPGQAYESGMGFVQFYFGLPIAMIIISIFILPIYYKLKVFTAYQYLEKRFDVRVRVFTAFLFLLSRGLAAGITIYAPAIILSSLLGWNIQLTCFLVGLLVIIYTVSGGSRAVSLTQKWQMAIIMGGMFAAFYYVIKSFPEGVGFKEGFDIAGNLGKMNAIDLSIDPKNRYTLFSGIFGGVFLFLSYFGTDQSQVQRYLGGESLKASRMGLMFNGILKIPMQFFILLVGAMVFVSFQFNEPPIIFNKASVKQEILLDENFQQKEEAFKLNFNEKKEALNAWVQGENVDFSEIRKMQENQDELRKSFKEELLKADKNYITKDSDYIFLSFVLKFLPAGLIGLLLAVILSAAMSSTSGELNALASTTTIDYYKKFWGKEENDQKDILVSKLLTVAWGIIAILIALVAGLFENLIQLVNILGSLFYGTILGIFLLAFFFKNVKAKAALFSGIFAQIFVLLLHALTVWGVVELSYLLYNIIGSLLVVITGIILKTLFFNHKSKIN